jgi:hypothetical protein
MIIRSFLGHPVSPTPKGLRAESLAAAIVLRNCATSARTSNAGRRACRTLMREQALQWRDARDISLD